MYIRMYVSPCCVVCTVQVCSVTTSCYVHTYYTVLQAFSGRKVTVSTTPMKLTSTMGVDREQSADKPLLAVSLLCFYA